MTAFTIILPTTGDRGQTLQWVLPHVVAQSLTDWELFVIGDGIDAQTRASLHEWCAQDSRIQLFDRPKEARRGEPYRHQALAHARGRNIAYLCDRDLWLHDHLARLAAALEERDFAHTAAIHILPDDSVSSGLDCNLESPQQRAQVLHRGSFPLAMSTVGHTLASYRQLPFGWRTTPTDRKTDHYMWHQFLREGAASCRSECFPTVLYFNRGDHPGWPSAQRAAELQRWHGRVAEPAAQDQFRDAALQELRRPGRRLRHQFHSWLFWHPQARERYLRWRQQLSALRWIP